MVTFWASLVEAMTRYITLVPVYLRLRCPKDQDSVAPGAVSTSWYRVPAFSAFSSANWVPSLALSP